MDVILFANRPTAVNKLNIGRCRCLADLSVLPTYLVLISFFLSFICFVRDQGPVGGAAEMSGPADRNEGPAAAGPSGLLQKEGGNRDGVLQKP